jgi:hypothetical protein
VSSIVIVRNWAVDHEIDEEFPHKWDMIIRLHKKIDYTRSQHGEQWGGALEIAIYSTLRLRIRCRGRGGRGGDRL